MHVLLYLLGAKGLNVLEGFLEACPDARKLTVVVGRDAAVKDDFSVRIRELAEGRGCTCLTRKAAAQLTGGYDFAVAAGWRWMIDTTVSLVVFHDSPLPRYRGFAPLVNMLINGESTLTVTVLHAAEDYDAGAIIDQASVAITYPLTIAEAIARVSQLYRTLAQRLASQYLKRGVIATGTPQAEEQATYSIWRDEEDYHLNLTEHCERVARTIDALGPPYQGARLHVNDQLVRVSAAEALPNIRQEVPAVGKVMKQSASSVTVCCGTGAICITEAQYLDTSGVPSTSIFPLPSFRLRFR